MTDGVDASVNVSDVDRLLADLTARGIRLKVADGKLGYDAPPGVFDDGLKARVRTLRHALVASLDGVPIVAPLSPGQERMWFLNQLEGRASGSPGGSYTEHLAFSLTGPLDRAALAEALSAVTARHGALRTLFRDGPAGPEQVIAPAAPVSLAVVDLSARPDALDRALDEAAHRSIDLATDSHVRFTLFVLAAGHHVLSVSAHHAAWDGWSNGVFAADLSTAYNAARTGRPTALPPLVRDIADLARARRAALSSRELDAPLKRLCRMLDGFPDRLNLPTDRPRAAVADGLGAALTVHLEPAAIAALAMAGRRAGATPYMTMLAAWALLLARLANTPRLLVGAPVAAREDAAEEAVIGYLSNTVAIPVDVSRADSFGALVTQVRDSVLEIMTAQCVPFELVAETLALPRSRATTPLVQSIFAMQPRTVPAPLLDGLTVTVLPYHNQAARYELMLNLETTSDGALEGPLTYATSLFDRATIAGWIDRLLAFVREAPQRWDAPLDRSPIETPHGSSLTHAPDAPVLSAIGSASARSTQGTATSWDGFATATERALAKVWGEFLHTPPTSRDDDFFELGGHSLLLMRVIHRLASGGLGRLELADALGATRLSIMATLIAGVPVPDVRPSGPNVTPAAQSPRDDPDAATPLGDPGRQPQSPVRDLETVACRRSTAVSAMPAAKGTEDYPANSVQEGMWLARRDDPASVTWMVPLVILMPFPVEPATVRAALEMLAARHPALRTTLCERAGAIVQHIATPGPVELTEHHGLDAAARVALMRRELARPFDMDRVSLYRFHLFCTGGLGDAVFAIADHAVIDGWSIDVLRHDLVALVEAVATGRDPGLPALTTSPAAVAAGRQADTSHLAALRAYWLDTLRGIELGDSIAPGTRPPGVPPRGRRTMVDFSAAALTALDRIARSGATTPTVALIAGVGALVARMKNDGREVSIATPFVGRTAPEHANLIGCFVEVLPLRLPAGLGRTFAACLGATRRALSWALAHQDYPLRQIMRDLQVTPGGPTSIYDAVAVLEDGQPETRDWYDPRIGAGKYDLAFVVSRLPGGDAILSIEHDEWQYNAGTARALAARLESLLLDAAARPDAEVGDLDFLPEAERVLVTETFNVMAAPYPRDASMADLWRAAVDLHSGRTALVAPDGSSMTYAALDRRADEIANALLSDAPAEPTVALAVERGFDAVAAILGIWKAGAAYLPLDAKLPPSVVAKLMSDAEARVILADASNAERLSRVLPSTALLRLDAQSAAGPPASPVIRHGGDQAYVMFTSGTTGTPKGVMVPHRGIARLALNHELFGMGPGDVMCQLAPLAFDATTLELWTPLLNGATLQIVADEDLLDSAALGAMLRRSGATVLWLTSGLLNLAAEQDPGIFAGLRLLMSGGETLSPPHIRRVLDACPGLRLWNAYGPTENSCFTTAHTIVAADLNGPIPIGRPIANTRVFVVDERMNPVPVGVWGELVCAGDGLALGYAGRPDLTDAAFITLPWGAGERIYRSGDIARWRADGVIEFGGRRDGQVKIRGQRIETGAIEAVLAGCEDVRDAAVVVVGEGADRVLFAVVAADSTAREGAWRRRLAERLPIYMMPARFVAVPSLPVNANGKRDRRALLSLVTAVPATDPVVAPSVDLAGDSAERLVARVFAELLPGTAVDRTSDFFHLGGHSILVMRLSARLEDETGRVITMRELFAARTVEAIAALLEGAVHAEHQPVRATRPADAEPASDFALSRGQERLWVMQRLFPESSVYNVPIVFDADGPLDADALARAFMALEERHHALRLRVITGADGRLRQRLAPVGGLKPTLIDLSGEADPSTAADARLAAEVTRPFVLDRESGARAFLMHLGTARWRVLLVIHHSIVDGWSTGIILRDLATLYSQAVGLAVDLPAEPSVQFEKVAEWQRAVADSDEGKALLARWTDRITPLPEPLTLPADRRRPSVRSLRGDTIPFAFDARHSAAIDRLARAESATPFAVTTALVQALLHRLTGQSDLALGTLVAGRDRWNVQDSVGFFINTLVLRQRIDPAFGFRHLLNETRSTCLHAVADQHCPFETLVESVDAPRDLSRNPLFDVLVVWQSDDMSPPSLPGVTTLDVPFTFPFAKFDLSFHFGRKGDRIVCQIEYSADLFEAATVADLFARLETLTSAVIADPEQPLASLSILPDAERQLVVERFNETTMSLDTRRTIVRPFLDRVAAAPSAPAVLWNREAPLDYRGFAARAGAVAQRLVAAGVGPGDTVAVCAPRSPDLLVAIYGIVMAGAAYAPLAADEPAARTAGMLEDLGWPLVLAAPECRARVAGRPDRVLPLTDDREGDPLDAGAPDGLAYVLFTSGSTGRPKGVAIEHHAVLNRILWMQATFPIGPGDVILQKTAVTFDVSVWELFWWAWTGAAVALPPPGAERDPQALVGLIERDGVTVVHFVPSMLAAFLTCLEDGRADARRLKRLRYVFASGEALDSSLVERFDRLLHQPFGIALHNLYGPTEATVDVTWHPCSPWTGGEVVPIGRPIANTTVYVLDGAGSPTPLGVPGEIHLGGPQVARGYVNRPDLTRERFIPDPFADHGQLYRTGDLGRWRRDGTIEYLGRIDNQVKVRGQRIEPGEVEHALETHPAVERAVVVPVTVDGLTELHGYVVTRDVVTAASLTNYVRDRVTDAMVPARFYRMHSVPTTSSGKIDRRALTGTRLDVTRPPVAETLSDVEAEIRAIWKTLLPDAEPGSRDGFFEAGGNSLLVIRLHEKLNARWPGVWTVTDLFSCATIADQAKRVAPHVEASSRTDVRRSPEEGIASVPDREHRDHAPAPSERAHAVAVVGMAVRLPGSEDLSGYWRDVSTAADRVRPLPADREADTRALMRALGFPVPEQFGEGGYLDDVMGFDPKRLRMSPADATLLEPEQRLFLDTALRALEDAGRGGTALDDARVGVFVGGTPGAEWRGAMMHTADARRKEQVLLLNVPSNIATRLSFLHNWRGPAALFDTACSSALVATHNACRALREGECDWALVGGAKAILVPHAKGDHLSIDSSTSRTHAFDESADGTGMGEGCVVFLLRPLRHALAEGDAIHGVILGSAVNQDGASSGMAAPNPAAQAEVIAAAAADAGISLSTLSYIEAHGTGTALGDPVEISGLTRAFARDTAETGFAAIGSGKGNYGHLDGAAGALGLSRALLCLAHDSAPPQPFFESPNSRIDFAKAPVAVARTLAPLADRGCPRRAGVSAFGLSGINAHVVIEAAPRIARDPDVGTRWIAVGLSAPDEASLRGYAGAVVAALRSHPDWPLADIARTLVDGRDGLDARLAVWARDRGDLMARLAVFAAAPEAVDGMVVTGTAARSRSGESVPAVHREEAAALAASTAFVAGSRLTWPTDTPAGHVHLPAAPLVRRRYVPEWVPAQMATESRAGLLGPPTITEQGHFFTLDVHSATWWPVADHLMDGAKTLVGMAFPALVDEAMPGGGTRIRDLRWMRPLRPADLDAGTVTLAIAANGAATLSGRTTAGQWQTFVKATAETVETAETVDAETLDLAALLGRCASPTDAPPFTRTSGSVEVSERWNCLERVAQGDHECLAWLRRPDGDPMPRLHPGLLDVAVGQALTEDGLVPTGCDEVVVSGALPTDPIAHIIHRATADGAEADVRLADRVTGRVAVALLGLRFTRVGRGRASSRIVPSRPRWVESPLDARDNGQPVVLIGEGPLAERMAAHLGPAGRLVARSGSAALDATARARIGAVDAPAIILAPAGGADAGTRAAGVMVAVITALRGPVRLLALGEGAFEVEDAGPLDPFQALVYGVVAAATLEETTLTARYVDCDGATPPAALLAELAVLERDPNIVAWRGGTRFVRRFEPAEVAEADGASWPTTGCCVVSGGTGGLALMLAETLAAGGRVGLALLSRTGSPVGDDSETDLRRESLEALRTSGLRVETYTCDVADRGSLAAALDCARREIGPITAVVHNASSSAGSFLSNDRNGSIYADALRAKVAGALMLDELTGSDPVEAFVMAGSLTALTGSPGFAAYTGANAFLDAFASQRRRRGVPALTIDWCGIRDMGMGSRMAARHGFRPDAGSADVGPLLRRALAMGSPQVALIIPEIQAVLAVQPVVKATPAATGRTITPAAPDPPAPRGATASRALEAALSAVWADVLGYESVAKDDDFYALGGDSIGGMQIVEQVVRELGVQMTLVDLFETANVAALAERLRGRTAERRQHTQGLQASPRRDRYPVAWEQLAVLRAEAASDMGTGHNLPNGLHLPDDVDLTRLRAALDALIERHEILRTRLVPSATENGEPTMEILPPAPAAYEELNCPTEAALEGALENVVRPFDLWNGMPPMRIVIGLVAGQPRAVMLDVHHAMADAFTLEVLLVDLVALYSGTAGPVSALQLKDYAWWSREGGGAAAPDEARAYWMERFKGLLPVLDLPADRLRPARHTWRSAFAEFRVSNDVVSRLRAFAAERRTTPFAVVTAVWALLLSRLARIEELVLAVAVNSREGAEMAGMTGMLVSLLPLRLAVKPDDSVADLVLRTHTAHAEALGHRAYGLGQLLADLAPPASPDRPLLSEVILSYMNFTEGSGQGDANGGFRRFGLGRKEGKCDLGIFVRDVPDSLVTAVEYYVDLYDAERVERMGRNFCTLLAAVTGAGPDTPVTKLSMLPDAERQLVVERFNHTTVALDTRRTIVRPFLDRLATAPSAPAVLWNSEAPLDYRGFAASAGAVARRLVEAGVGPGDTVAVCAPRSPDLLIAIYGIVMAGAAYAPLAADQPAARTAGMLEDLGWPFVLAAPECRALLADRPDRVLALTDGSEADPIDAGIPDGLAYVLFTSGSTGRPKGVAIEHHAVLNRILWMQATFPIGPGDVILQKTAVTFDVSVWELFWWAWTGAAVALPPPGAERDPQALVELIERDGVTVVHFVPSMLAAFLTCLEDGRADARRLKRLRYVFASGEALDSSLVERFDRLLHQPFGTALHNLYGPTEATVDVTWHPCSPWTGDAVVPIGRPIANTTVYVLDGAGSPTPIGVPGEIHLGGPQVARGYVNRPDLTRERFIPDRFAGHGRLYRTGDLGRWRADGVLEFIGRIDRQIKLRGFRIELEEIEHALNSHPGVAASAVLFLRDDSGDDMIVACVHPLAEPPRAAALRDWLGLRLPDYMVPRRFVTVPALPTTSSGKIDREALVAALPPPAADDEAAGDPPCNATERQVADVFAAVFGRPVNNRDASFLDMGGHSLLAIKVVNRLAQATGVELSMRDFFATPTVAALASLIETGGPESEAIPRLPDAPAYQVSHAQARLYLASRMDGAVEGDGTAYNMTFALPHIAAIDLDALRAALRQLLARHETLRTAFVEDDGHILQRIATDVEVSLAVDDLSAFPDPYAECLRLVRRDAATPFDLASPPLLRARAIRIATRDGGDWLVVLVIHHIVGDGWSSRILLRELDHFYRSAKGGVAATLPALPIAYRDFAAWHNRRDWTGSVAHWRSMLAGAPERIALPTDRPAPGVPSHRGNTVSRTLPAALSEALAAYARRCGTTGAPLGLALFAGLLYRLTRQDDMVISMGVAGRDRTDVEGLIGFFVNIMPVRIRVGDDTEFEPLVEQIHSTMLVAMDHRDCPFDLIVRAVAPRRAANRQPLANVGYEYQRFEDLDGVDEGGRVLGESRAPDPAFGDALVDAIRTPTAKHDLLLFLTERKPDWEFALEYDTDLFDRATAERWLDYLEQFAAMVVNDARRQ